MRCWIVWGQNIRVVVIPSFLAITYYLGQSLYAHLISQFQLIASSYLATSRVRYQPERRNIYKRQLEIFVYYRGDPVDPNKFRRAHGRKYPGDGLHCHGVQDRQGVLGS